MSFIEISKEEFLNEILKCPDREVSVYTISEPPIEFFWKTKSKPGDDRSHGKGAFAYAIWPYNEGDQTKYYKESNDQQ